MCRFSIIPFIVFIATIFSFDSAANGERGKDASKTGLITDWAAAGSGCAGRLSKATGDVSFALTPPDSSLPNRYSINMKLKKFRLESPVPEDQGKTNLEFARDCAIRLAISPPKGKKINYVEARTAYSFTKPENTDLKAGAELWLGMTTLSSVTLEFQKHEKFSNLEREVRLAPGNFVENVPLETKCGQAKLLGIDLTFYVNRPDEFAKVDMLLSGAKNIDIFVDLVDCHEGL